MGHTLHRRVRAATRSALISGVGVLAAMSALAVATPAASAAAEEPTLPIVFVHGATGSGAQYETQALRWASNGYPNVVTAIDRISTTPSVIYPILDDFFDALMEQTGDAQVYVLGHSAGTFVMNGYLNSSPERAARVAKYIGIDGATAATCPGGVTCMGIWARGSTARVLGPNNARFPEHGHTHVVGAADSFAVQYQFLTGDEPATTLVLPEAPGQVEIAGRALNFPANTGIAGSVLRVYEVDPATGARTAAEPRHTVMIGDDGHFGPLKVNGQQRYELELQREGVDGPIFQHFYYEPFIRSNSLLRLNLAPVSSPLSTAIQRGPHTTVSIVRQKEWWGANTVDPTDVDTLEITTARGTVVEAAGNIVNGATAPYTASTIAVISFDIGVDQTTDTSALFPLGAFLSGVDVYMPAAHPSDGTITFDHQQRGTTAPQVINTPNWSSEDGHSMTVTFRDWVQDIDSWGACKQARPSPCG